MLETFITVVHVLVVLFMIAVVLVQGGSSGGVGATFGGGGNSSGVFGATGAQTFLGKVTYVVAAVFMLTSITLSVMQGKSGDVGIEERLRKKAQQEEQKSAPDSQTPDAASTPKPAQESAPQK